jgi:hypothetical protein
MTLTQLIPRRSKSVIILLCPVKFKLLIVNLNQIIAPKFSLSSKGFFAEYADLRPHLFARYIPNVLPPTQADELDRYIEETQQMQRDLRTHPLFTR